MNFVQPIRDPECIFYIKRFLKEQSERNYMLFVTGINSGLRISDILELRVRDAKRPYFNLIAIRLKYGRLASLTLSSSISDMRRPEFIPVTNSM